MQWHWNAKQHCTALLVVPGTIVTRTAVEDNEAVVPHAACLDSVHDTAYFIIHVVAHGMVEAPVAVLNEAELVGVRLWDLEWHVHQMHGPEEEQGL